MVWEAERQDSLPWDIHIPVKGKEGSSNLVKLLLGAKFHMRYFTKSLSFPFEDEAPVLLANSCCKMLDKNKVKTGVCDTSVCT